MLNRKFILLLISACTFCLHADINDYNKRRDEAFSRFKQVKQNAEENFEKIRRQANEEFANRLLQSWEPTKLRPIDKPPVNPTPPPVIMDETAPSPLPRPITIQDVIENPTPSPKPQPVAPIVEVPDVIQIPTIEIILYGTVFKFRQPDFKTFKVSGNKREDFARGWKQLSAKSTNNLIRDCLNHRKDKQLCDWAYLRLLQEVAKKITKGDNNSVILLTGFLFAQSGYKMRFAIDERKQLHLFFSPTGIVYNNSLLIIDGDRYYSLDNGVPIQGGLEICKFSFPGENPLSFEIPEVMNLEFKPSPERRVVAHNHPEVVCEVVVNENLIEFYNTYPEATISDDPLTLWAINANTPASPEIRNSLYPTLRRAVEGKTDLEGVNILLHLAQSFKYGYDEEIWGRDRAFFMDESWYYPYSDCEDHAINFARMVRDIMNLDVALVSYPDHLAAAVAFTDPEVNGDYFNFEGKKYIICDPTIFYSNVGRTMRGMNNAQAVLIPLRKN